MKILHLCGDLPNEGAATGVLNLHEALLRKGVDSSVLFARGCIEPSQTGVSTFFGSRVVNAIAGMIYHRIEPVIILLLRRKKVVPFSLGLVGYPNLLKHRMLKEADVIHLHWINGGFVNIAQLSRLGKPIVWTIRDEWPYTGGCHYTGDCVRFEQSCGKCPMLSSINDSDLSRSVHERKSQLGAKPIRYVAISEWIRDRASHSSLLRNHSVEVVSNGIDHRYFESGAPEKEECRRALGLPTGVKLLLAGAQSLDSPYKGYRVLEGFKPADAIPYQIVTFGSISEELKSRLNVPAVHLGKVSSFDDLRMIYRACDVFIGPSRMEAFGKTLAEASASGLPVVAYNYGGPADIVDDSVTGVLVEPFDETHFVQAALELLANDRLCQEMGASASVRAKELFDSDRLCLKYIDIYASEMG